MIELTTVLLKGQRDMEGGREQENDEGDTLGRTAAQP